MPNRRAFFHSLLAVPVALSTASGVSDVVQDTTYGIPTPPSIWHPIGEDPDDIQCWPPPELVQTWQNDYNYSNPAPAEQKGRK
jgi:hypothetical protein